MDQNYFSSGLGNLPLIMNAQTRSISAENITGGKGMAAKSTDGAAQKAAAHLGQGWKVSPYFVIKPNTEFCLADIDGSGKIESIWFGGNVSRDYILRFYWDNAQVPAVECPLAEFFAYGWQIDTNNPIKGPFHQLNSIPVVVNPNRGFNCFWPMPFKSHCKVTIENRSEKEYVCFYQINYSLMEIPDNIGYFHAQYRQKCPVDYKEEFVILDDVKGNGQYIGTALFVGLNGAGNWWGEGELKFYLDGDKEFPTICTTGTEDYFGGSYDWDVDGKYTTYTTAYMGMYQVIQSDNLYNHQQRFSMYRWHIMDPIRFQNDIKLTIQDLGWSVVGEKYLARRDDIASVAYWYQDGSSLSKSVLPDCEEMKLV